MCAIIGQTAGARDALERGLERLAHRGPDGKGIAEEDGVLFGHRRLAIIDLSARADQPMRSASGTTRIVFNGEIYNYRELRRDLEGAGVRFSTESDTEVLLEGYEREGAAFFSRLRGMWALAIHDTRSRTIVLARDRFGIKPLYYSTEGGELHFASETKGLIALLPRVTPNAEQYYQFFNLGYFIPPATHLREIKKLSPGEVAVWDIGKHEIASHILPMPEQGAIEVASSLEASAAYLDSVLKDSVRAHFVSDVPVGLLLSGGNDSSLIAALAATIGERPLLYNLAIEGSPDAGYAKRVAEHLSLPLRSLTLTKAALSEQYERIWDFIDEPTADPSIIPTSLIFSAIKGDAKVVLSGEGGDEWFGGYLRHAHLTDAMRMRAHDPLLAVLDSVTGSSRPALEYLNPMLRRARESLLKYGLNDAIGAYLAEAKTIDFPIVTDAIRHDLLTLYEHAPRPLRAPAGLVFDRLSYLPNDLMHKTDAASMASSVEARVPFLDREVLRAVAYGIDPKYCLSSAFTEKKLLKKVLERYLPHELIYRPKTGFSFSFETYEAVRFKEDFKRTLGFHREHARDFGLPGTRLLAALVHENADIIAHKYPRFAFGLISNWKAHAS